MTRARLTAGVTAGAIGLVLIAASCNTTTGTPAGSDTPSASAQKVAVGSAVHVTDSAGASAFVTVEGVKYYPAGTGSLAQKPANGLYAVVDVLVQDDSGQYNTNPLYVKYQEPDGTTYDAFSGNAITAGYDPQLSSGTLNAGQKTRGNVVFDIKAAGGLIQVTDPLGAVIGQWTAPTT